MLARVTWDPGKAASNWRRHGVRFEEARTAFHDPLIVSSPDDSHSDEEDRFVAIGTSITGQILVISYSIRDDEAWIISARSAERVERRRYMEGERIHDAPAEAETIPTVDFSRGVRGRHYIPPRGPITVEIEPVVAEYFGDAASVNQALRTLIAEGRAPEPLPR